MTDAAIKNDSSNATQTTVDAGALRSELQTMRQDILGTMQTMLREAMAAKPEPPASSKMSDGVYTDDPDLKDEAEALGLDKAQFDALTKLIEKRTNKYAPKIKSEIKRENEIVNAKAQINQELASKYPDILKQGSPLFNQAQIEFQKLDPAIRESAYGTKLAVIEAAQKLGVNAISERDAMADMARNPSGGADSTKNDDKKQDEELVNFSSLFNISPEKMKKGIDVYNFNQSFGKKKKA